MSDQPSHLPPQSLEAEEAILGAMLISTKAIDAAYSLGLRAEDFYRPSHQTIFTTILELHDKGTVDELTVKALLEQRGQLGDVGGFVGLATLLDRVPAIANHRAYAQEVIDQADLRNLVTTGHEIARFGYEHPDEPEVLRAEAGRLVDALGDRHRMGEDDITTMADELQPFVEELQERFERGSEITGLPSGLATLDEKLGGIQPKFMIIAGRPGMGKSALASGIGEAIAFGADTDVYFVNLEMREREQTGRAMSRHAGMNLHRTTNGQPTEHDVEQAAQAAITLYEGAKRIHLDRSSDLTMAQIRQRARKLARKLKSQGRTLGLVVIDYLQLVGTPAGVKEDNEVRAITVNSRMCKAMQIELGVPVIALSQLNRGVEERNDKRPTMRDLRGSGSIEQDADQILLMFRPEYYDKEQTPPEWMGKAQVEIAKFRGGQRGTIVVGWDGPRTRFYDLPASRPGQSSGVAA